MILKTIIQPIEMVDLFNTLVWEYLSENVGKLYTSSISLEKHTLVAFITVIEDKDADRLQVLKEEQQAKELAKIQGKILRSETHSSWVPKTDEEMQDVAQNQDTSPEEDQWEWAFTTKAINLPTND